MAKLYLNKLFPKLVSSLAVLLLLCQFGYVACQPTGVYIPSRNATLPDDEGTHARYTFPSTYISFSYYIQKKRKKICLSVKYELFLLYLLIPIQADPLLFQITQLIISYQQVSLTAGCLQMKVHTHDILFHLHIYPFPTIYKKKGRKFGYLLNMSFSFYIF